ncbi:MAG TPA: recombinase family protein [Tepidisphaeraceae bacterium]|jgi:site-specific DNA recombinase
METTTARITVTDTFVAGYIRLTRDESLQNNLSAPAQTKGIKEYAHRAKLEPLRIFEETKAVGGDVPFEKRRAGRELIEAVKAGKVRAIIVRDIDRLTRDMGLGLELLEICRESNCTIHTFTGQVQTRSASDRFAYHVRSAAAEFEKNQTGDRIRKAQREMACQGRTHGVPAFGYRSQSWHKSQLIREGASPEDAELQAVTLYPQRLKWYIYEPEAEIIRVIYSLAASGLGSRRIVSELNKRGYRTRTGVLWSTERLSRTINNPSAAGFIAYDLQLEETGKVTPKQRQARFQGKHEPIISLQEWQAVQTKRQFNSTSNLRGGDLKRANRKYLLSGILTCTCGSPMRGKSSSKRHLKGWYVCTKRFYRGRDPSIGGCDSPASSINAGRVHESFWPYLRKLIDSPNLVDRTFEAIQRVAREQAKQKNKAEDIEKVLAKVEQQIALWYRRHDAASNEAEQDAAWRRIVELTNEKKAAENTKKEQKKLGVDPAGITREQIESYLKEMGKNLAHYDGPEAQQYVRNLVDIHGLTATMTSKEAMTLSLGLRTPGVRSEIVQAAIETPMPLDKPAAWLAENQGKHKCEQCGKPVTLVRHHFWQGIPKHHGKCWTRELARRRNHRDDGLLTGAALARLFGVGDSTICRWRQSGKLPKPLKGDRGTWLWSREQVLDLLPRP